MRAVLTITVTDEMVSSGLMASLSTQGDFADESLDHRFYSIPEEPPGDLPPYRFWGALTTLIGGFLSQD
jgi:hypothetical protein